MREYGIFAKDGEVIYKLKSENIMDATKRFAFIKQMNVTILLELFEIKEIIN